jgi:hypothetical protein
MIMTGGGDQKPRPDPPQSTPHAPPQRGLCGAKGRRSVSIARQLKQTRDRRRPRSRSRWSRALCPVRDVDGWQVTYLVLGEVEPYAVIDARDGTERDSHSFLTPKVPVVEQDVCHAVIARIDR